MVRILSDKSKFPNITYKYERYNDSDFNEYYKKIAHALTRINSKYVMFADNDDFLLPQGINRSIDFLNTNDDFVGASGRIGFFYLFSFKTKKTNNFLGTPYLIFPQHGGYAPRSLDKIKAVERIESAAQLYNVTYYSVFRTITLRHVASENAEICFNSLYSSELFLHLKLLCSGRIHFDSDFSSYIRQLGSSAGGGGNEDVFNEITSGRLAEDYSNLTRNIINGISLEESEKKLIEKNINIFLGKYLKDRIIAQLNHGRVLYNRFRILYRKVMTFFYPSYHKVLRHYRLSKDVKQSPQIENNNELLAVKACLNDIALKEFLLLSGIPFDK